MPKMQKNDNQSKKTFSKLEVTYFNIDDLIPYKNNAKIHPEDHVEKLANNMRANGFTVPISIGEDNVIIAGHGRLLAARKAGISDIPCIIQKQLDTKDKKKAYTLADNNLHGNKYDEKMMMREVFALDDAKFDLSLTGLDQDKLDKFLGSEERENAEASVKFSDELLPEHNYIVLYFDNEIDWLSAKTHFDIESVHSKRQNGKPWSKGIGRVINGAKYLTDLKTESTLRKSIRQDFKDER